MLPKGLEFHHLPQEEKFDSTLSEMPYPFLALLFPPHRGMGFSRLFLLLSKNTKCSALKGAAWAISVESMRFIF
jgi:hypothetical protein